MNRFSIIEIYLFAFSLICLNCSSNQSDIKSQILQLYKKDSISIGDASLYYSCYDHFHERDVDYLYCYNLDSNKIHKYLFPQGRLISQIEIPSQLGTIKDFCVIDNNCIIIQLQNSLSYYLINESGQIIDSVNIKLKKYLPLPSIGNCNPVLKNENSLYLTGYTGGVYEEERKGDRFILVKYNLQNGTSMFYVDYPEIYYKFNYGGLQYRKVYNTINPQDSSIIFSFPATHQLYLFHINEKRLSEIDVEDSNKPEISPFSKTRDWYGYLAKQDYTEYYYSSPSYSEIYYDSYNKFYYRIVELPNPEFDFHKQETYYKDKMIITYNTNFNILCYAKLSDRVYSNTAIITPGGIYFKSADQSISNKWYLYSFQKK